MDKKTTITVLSWAGTAFALGLTSGLGVRTAMDSIYDQTYVQKGSYLLRVDVAQNYIPKDQVERDYIAKRELPDRYVSKAVHDETVRQLAALQSQIQKQNEVLSVPPRLLDAGDSWVSQRPPFAIKFASYAGSYGDIQAQIRVATQEGGNTSHWLSAIDPQKRYDVTYEGKVYGVLSKLIKVGSGYKIQVSVILIN